MDNAVNISAGKLCFSYIKKLPKQNDTFTEFTKTKNN